MGKVGLILNKSGCSRKSLGVSDLSPMLHPAPAGFLHFNCDLVGVGLSCVMFSPVGLSCWGSYPQPHRYVYLCSKELHGDLQGKVISGVSLLAFDYEIAVENNCLIPVRLCGILF